MSESVKPVHRQLIALGERAVNLPVCEDRLVPQWASHDEWLPKIMVLGNKWKTDEATGRIRLSRAYFVVFDGLNPAKVLADRAVSRRYLDHDYGHYFLEEFRRFFNDEAAVCLGGLVPQPADIPEDALTNAFGIKFSGGSSATIDW